MLRRTIQRPAAARTAQYPGPTLAGWGRSSQKRRLEYETKESKDHKREPNFQWDVAGSEFRSTDYIQVRTYFSFPNRMGHWLMNWGQHCCFAILPAATVLTVMVYLCDEYDKWVKRAAWW